MNYEQLGRNIAGALVDKDPASFGRMMSGFFDGLMLAQDRFAARLRKELLATELRKKRLAVEVQKERLAEELRKERLAEEARKELLAHALLDWLSMNVRPGEFVLTGRIANVLNELNGTPLSRPGRVLGAMIAGAMLPGVTHRHKRTGNGIIYMQSQGERA